MGIDTARMRSSSTRSAASSTASRASLSSPAPASPTRKAGQPTTSDRHHRGGPSGAPALFGGRDNILGRCSARSSSACPQRSPADGCRLRLPDPPSHGILEIPRVSPPPAVPAQGVEHGPSLVDPRESWKRLRQPRHRPRRRGPSSSSPARSSPSSATTAGQVPPSSRRSPAKSFPMRARSCWTKKPVRFHSPLDARRQGNRDRDQDLAVAPAMSFRREPLPRRRAEEDRLARCLGALDKKRMAGRGDASHAEPEDRHPFDEAGRGDPLRRPGQGVAVARSAAFARHVVIMDEPTAALGVKEGNMGARSIRRVPRPRAARDSSSATTSARVRIADRIHIARLGNASGGGEPRHISMSDTVAVMTAQSGRKSCWRKRSPEAGS